MKGHKFALLIMFTIAFYDWTCSKVSAAENPFLTATLEYTIACMEAENKVRACFCTLVFIISIVFLACCKLRVSIGSAIARLSTPRICHERT